MIAGVVSIGTNSTRALAARINGEPHVILARSTGTRIGEGLRESGELQPQAMRRTLDAVREHVNALRACTREPLRAIATSALRRASNAQAFAREVEAIAGAPLEIISGEEEARRSYAGAVSAAPESGPYGVLDTGGGSSEYATGDAAQPGALVSCEIGAVRLTEAVPQLAGVADAQALERARALARDALRPAAELPAIRTLLIAGGSATTAISTLAGERRPFAYAPLSQAELQRLVTQLSRTPLEARKALPGMNPQRADILLAGAILLDEFFALTGHERALVTTNDLLLGTLLAEREHGAYG